MRCFHLWRPLIRGHGDCCLPTLKIRGGDEKLRWFGNILVSEEYCSIFFLLLPSKFVLLDNRIFRKNISNSNEKDCYS